MNVVTTGTPGARFAALATATPRKDVELGLHIALPTAFPLAATRPRYTVRHLLKTREIGDGAASYLRETHRGSDRSGTSYASTPEAGFRATAATAQPTGVTAELSVPAELTADPELLGTIVDHRLIVRLCTQENDALLNGSADGRIPGIRTLSGARRIAEPGADLARLVTETAALVEETGGSCDGIITHPVAYWELVRLGLLPRLVEVGVRVSRTRMLPPHELIFADFRAAFTLLDTMRSHLAIRRGAGQDGQDLLTATVSVGLAVHLPQHVVSRTAVVPGPPD